LGVVVFDLWSIWSLLVNSFINLGIVVALEGCFRKRSNKEIFKAIPLEREILLL